MTAILAQMRGDVVGAGLDGKLRRAVTALHINLGGPGRNAMSGSRSQVFERLRELFVDARELGKRRSDFDRNQLRALSASRADLEALLPALARTLPVVFWADRQSDILAALELSREFRLKPLIAGGAEAWRVADVLAREKVPVLLQPSRNLPSTFDALDVTATTSAPIARATWRAWIPTPPPAPVTATRSPTSVPARRSACSPVPIAHPAIAAASRGTSSGTRASPAASIATNCA